MNKRDTIQLERYELELQVNEYEIEKAEKHLFDISQDAPNPDQREAVNSEIFYAEKDLQFMKLERQDTKLSIHELNREYDSY